MSVWCGSRSTILMQYYATSGHAKCLVMLNDNPALNHTELHFLKEMVHPSPADLGSVTLYQFQTNYTYQF